MNSLRWRLLATASFTIVLVLAVAWFATRRTTADLFDEFLLDEIPQVVQGPPPLADYRDELLAHHAEHGDWDEVRGLLDRIEGELDGRYSLLFMPGARRGTFELRGPDVELVDEDRHLLVEERFVIQLDDDRNQEIESEPFELRLHDAAGGELARLIAVPEFVASGDELTGRFSGSLRWRLFVGLGAAGLVGLLLTFAVTRRILRPIDQLTIAARRMGSGDLDHRLKVGQADELGRLAATFNEMADSLAQAERLRRDLVGDVAHELRTPLTNLRCQLEAAQDGLLPPSPELLTSLHSEIVHLSRVVDDLQELGRAEAGQLQLAPQHLDARHELARCVERFPAERGRLSLDVRDAPSLVADPERLQQVLANLVRNALQHGPTHGLVTLVAFHDTSGVRIEVRDQGPVLPADELELLFGRFHRRDRSRSRSTGGVGLGLAIVKQLVEAMGGAVGAETAAGGGVTFWLRLPLEASSPAARLRPSRE